MSARRRALAVMGLVALASWPGGSARGEWEPVRVHLHDGRAIDASLVGESDQAITLSGDKGLFQVRRDEIARIEDADGELRPLRPVGAKAPATGPSPGKALRGAGRRSQAEEKQADALLDRYFAAGSDAERQAAFAELDATRLGRTLAELEQMRELARAPRMQKHVPVPWRKGADRAWYNLALPADYTPARSWPLVLALHGMPSDGDNLVSAYCRYFPPRGFIVLLPTTVHRSSFWPAPSETQELLRLLGHVAALYRVDCRRIYCTGASGGGIGTWHWLVTLPELFAGGISFSAMGTIFDGRLARLKAVPFYVHHGTKDYIPIASVQRAVEAARGHGATIEFHVSEGTGHTPPQKDFQRAFDWLAGLPPKALSPRHLLDAPAGSLPIGYAKYQPFAAMAEAAAMEKVAAANRLDAGGWKAPPMIAGEDLVEGMVQVARIVDARCDAKFVRGEIARLAQAARAKAPADAKATDRLYALNEVFFQAEGFARDASDPARRRPEALAVHRVLRSRAGGALALTGIYCAVAKELDLPVWAVVAPAHAFARCEQAGESINVEMTELGGHFDDGVYRDGYLLRMPPTGAWKPKATRAMLAAQLGCLSAAAMEAAETDVAAALARLALDLDPTCYDALLTSIAVDRIAGRDRDAQAGLLRLIRAWPGYADPLRVQGELHQAGGNQQAAIESYQAALRAHIKPLAASSAFDAEVWCRIAEIHADRYEKARRTDSSSWANHMNNCGYAIVNCLRLDPAHARAREVLKRIGGRTELP